MKKMFLIPLMICVLVLSSCGGASLKAIDEKIEKDGIEAKFSSAEFDAMIGFIEKIFKENPQYDSSDDNQMEQAGEVFGRMFNYMMVLGIAKENGDLSSSQIAKLDELQEKAKQQVNNMGSGYQEDYGFAETEVYGDYPDYDNSENSEGTQKLIVDLNGNIVGDYVGETDSEYIGFAQDEFSVPKRGYKVIEANSDNGEGVVYCKEPGDVVKVYKEPSLNAPVIGKMIYEEGYLPQTYECIGKNGNWYQIRFNHKTGYVEVKAVEWSAEDYF